MEVEAKTANAGSKGRGEKSLVGFANFNVFTAGQMRA